MVVDVRWRRWLLAALAWGLPTALNFWLQPLFNGRIPWLPYFPALVLTGYHAGAGPGAAVLVGAALTVSTFWFDPVGVPWPVTRPSDLLIVGLFLLSGGMVVAVSARSRRLLRQARLGRERLHLALTAGRMAAWDWNVASGAVKFSEGAQALFGKTWSHVDEAWPLGHPDDVGRVRATVKAALREGSHYRFVSRMLRADTGELRWIETHGCVHRDPAGRPLRVSGVTADVTERQLALEASRAAEERFELALEIGKVTAWECDAQRRYTWIANTGFGLQPADVVGRRIGETIPNEAHMQALDRVYAAGEPVQFQVEGIARGQPYHLLCSARPVKDEAGRVARVVGASVDITELAAAQAQLRQESQRKDAFLATLAHELRNPMAPIRYAVAMLGGDTPAPVREQARAVIERQAAHMARLLDDLLDMSRITRNAIELQRAVLDLRAVVEQAADTARPAFARQRHRLVVSLPPDSVWVDGDSTRLQQVLGNLLDNAAKYTPPGGEVTLRLDRQGAEAVVAVIDNGVGIEPGDQAQVFELFTQVQRGGAGSGGLGIGLAVVRQLVELHGGSVRVHSEGAGRGSRFTVRLPLAARAPAPDGGAAVAQVVPLFAHGPAVLVVDDNRDAADSLAALLRAGGHSASAVYDGAAALQAFDSLRPGVVLLDLGLPDLSGLEVARRLRERAQGAPLTLVAITGWGQERDREATRQAGFTLHLVKPVDPAALQAVLQQVQAGMGETGAAGTG
ncbi:hybrid sensor histidine kinase/response regulator [Azohydromonas aeria]|uniref:hybrid sensor histidine kinase/response regulator n=1 Tax=Azohydromonas aeria TaxID=2590212 RepID=UPI0018DEF0D2|nr:ATP-binding protein [Azohydromonas aeria]